MKRKRCEPGHPPAGAELERLMLEAGMEDFYRSGRQPLHRRRRLPAVLMLASALAVQP